MQQSHKNMLFETGICRKYLLNWYYYQAISNNFMNITKKILLTGAGTTLIAFALSFRTAETTQGKFKAVKANSEAHTFFDFNNRLPFDPKHSKNTVSFIPEASTIDIDNILNFGVYTNTIANIFLVFNFWILITLFVLEILLIFEEEEDYSHFEEDYSN